MSVVLPYKVQGTDIRASGMSHGVLCWAQGPVGAALFGG